MAEKQVSGDGLASNLAGMSKNQLYDIMHQMKTLIEQNQQQARQILVQNPLLTRALFQAQIMLGMVQPPQAIPNIQPQASQQPQQPGHSVRQSNTPIAPPSSTQNLQDQTSVSQAQPPMRKHQPSQSPMPMSSTPTQTIHSQPATSQPVEQPRSHPTSKSAPLSLPLPSQVPNMPSLPLHSVSQTPPVQTSLPPAPGHLQQPMQTTGISHLPLQPVLPPQARPPSGHHQFQPQMGPNMNFPHSGIPQFQHSQPMFHPSNRPPTGLGPSFPQGQPPHSSQPPPHPLYKGGGSNMGNDFSIQGGSSMQMDRGAPWPPPRENAAATLLPGPTSLGPSLVGVGNQPRPPPLTPEMEQALLQQVMSLTPEQINLLPPEQRHQVLQLQQMLLQRN